MRLEYTHKGFVCTDFHAVGKLQSAIQCVLHACVKFLYNYGIFRTIPIKQSPFVFVGKIRQRKCLYEHISFLYTIRVQTAEPIYTMFIDA